MNNFIFKKYVQFIEQNGYFPMMFQPYNCSEITDISPTQTANCGCETSSAAVLIANLGDGEMNKDKAPVMVGGIGEINFGKQYRQGNRVYDANSIAMALLSSPVGNAGGFSYLYLVRSDKMNDEVQIIREEPLQCVGWHRNAKEVLSVDGLCRTLSTQSNNLATKIKEKETMRIRKLTPKECWRLMGFDDEDFYKAEAVNSNTQLYKQAGNSIVVDVLEAIFTNLKPYLSEREVKK